MINEETILICGAWPYVNGDIHIGHLPGYFIPGDITARYFRLKGKRVAFVSGTDCHGTPITVEADKRGLTPVQIVEEYDPKVRKLIEIYDFSYDNFSSTVSENHKKVVQDMFISLLNNGYIIKKKTKQYFSEQENRFLPDRYVEGECPICHALEQRSDQCENCGRSLDFGTLINPYSKISKSEVILKETEHYFIDFAKLQDKILNFAKTGEKRWRKWIYQETMGWLKEGLEPRAITRDIDWGIQIPKDRIPTKMLIENIESKRFYVWFEAVIGYLSATIEFCENNNLDYEIFWKNPKSRHFYVMGQDNVTFHTIFWPGQLIASDVEYTLPYLPSAVKFLNANGLKLSKSRGNIIDAMDVAQKYGTEAVKFYIISIMPENKESNWDWKHFQEVINKNLVGNIGNYINRVIVFTSKNFSNEDFDGLNASQNVVEFTNKTFIEVRKAIEEHKFTQMLNLILEYSSFGNKYFNDSKSWELVKTDKTRASQNIYDCLYILNNLRILLTPILHKSMKNLSHMLGWKPVEPVLGKDNYSPSEVDITNLQFKDIKILFKKIENSEIPV
ncbi:MAG: methionine--tRNA ligase [Candidatus Dojkabacteria bacterium]|nr:MAG: methionine--tRNA ligase [Candidatus Dojkabacteria bacterium]